MQMVILTIMKWLLKRGVNPLFFCVERERIMKTRRAPLILSSGILHKVFGATLCILPIVFLPKL